MSTLNDLETENARGFWSSFKRIDAHHGPALRRPTRREERGRVRGVEVEADAIVCLPPPRSPRTALGLGLLGAVAPPPVIRVSVTIDGPDSRTYDPRSLQITMADGTVLSGDHLRIHVR